MSVITTEDQSCFANMDGRDLVADRGEKREPRARALTSERFLCYADLKILEPLETREY